jgi:hypothetical protein
MRQEHFDLGCAHIALAASDEQDKPPHPIDAGVIDADAVIQPVDTGAHFIQHGIGLAVVPKV